MLDRSENAPRPPSPSEDYLKLRMDPCCHYNAEGHRALMPIMERIILEQLDGAPARTGLETAGSS